MKKLMFAAVAAMACVTAAEAVESNIVGYITDAPQNTTGYSFIIPTFTKVAGTEAAYSFRDIKLDSAADGSGMTDCIVGYDSAACLTGEDWYWCTPEGTFGGVEKEGWYGFMGMGEAPDTQIDLGKGVYLQLFNEAKVSIAGQVYTQSLESDVLPVGYTMIGNSTPVEIDLQDIKLIGGVDGSGMTDCIVGYDAAACLTGEDYYWCTPEGTFGGVESEGWYGFMGVGDVTGVKLQPGEGVYLQLFNEGVKFTLPSPMDK